MDNRINVCVSCDDNYAKYAGVVIASVLANADNDDNLYFYILDGGISEENKEKIASLKSIKNCEINFVSIDEKMFEDYKNVKTHQYISIATYYRLKAPTLLPDVDKLIYLDCDMVVNTSLKELFNKDTSNYLLAGVSDNKTRMVKENPTYVNAGMLVMDLNNMRKDGTDEKFFNYTKENINKITKDDINDFALKNNIRLNSNELKLPLYVRNKKDGDKIKVKGLSGTKKVKDIFIDEKVSPSKRQNFPILVDSDDKILWLPGLKKSKFDKQKDENYDIIIKYF